MTDTLRALWRDQEARHPEPPTPALIDALYEAGEEELAWRLHWCREWGVVPEKKQGLDPSDVWYTLYTRGFQVAVGTEFFGYVIDSLRSRRWWARKLHDSYAILLLTPQEKFPCK